MVYPAGNRFAEVENEYYRLRGMLDAGRITQQQLDDALRATMIQDAQGRYWLLSGDGVTWLVHNGQAWVPADPYAMGVATRPFGQGPQGPTTGPIAAAQTPTAQMYPPAQPAYTPSAMPTQPVPYLQQQVQQMPPQQGAYTAPQQVQRKRSVLLPVVLGVILLLALGGAGVAAVMTGMIKLGAQTGPTPTTVASLLPTPTRAAATKAALTATLPQIVEPTFAPTEAPTEAPTSAPTRVATRVPTKVPTETAVVPTVLPGEDDLTFATMDETDLPDGFTKLAEDDSDLANWEEAMQSFAGRWELAKAQNIAGFSSDNTYVFSALLYPLYEDEAAIVDSYLTDGDAAYEAVLTRFGAPDAEATPEAGAVIDPIDGADEFGDRSVGFTDGSGTHMIMIRRGPTLTFLVAFESQEEHELLDLPFVALMLDIKTDVALNPWTPTPTP